MNPLIKPRIQQPHLLNQRQKINRRLSYQPIRAASNDDLVVLPVFHGQQVQLPTFRGILHIFEPRYVSMFSKLQKQQLETGEPGRFLHILSHQLCPPSLLQDSPVKGYSPLGTCCIIDSITTRSDGTLLVEYYGHRRSKLMLVEPSTTSIDTIIAATSWYDDDEEERGSAITHAAEQDAAAIIKHIQKLSRTVDPENSHLPEAILQYAPAPPGSNKKLTSYDALKQARHKAADAIDIWRRHGSIYNNKTNTTSNTNTSNSGSDPYAYVAESMSQYRDDELSWRRAELFSFAVTQLLEMGVPERCALLLSQSTSGRLHYMMKAAQPYLQQLSAKASVKNAFGG